MNAGRRFPGLLAAAAAAALLGGCVVQPDRSGTVPAAAGAVEAAPGAWLAEAGTPVRMDGAASAIRLRVYRAGRLSHLGHNHVVEVTGLSGRLRRLESGGGLAELQIRPERMRVDAPEARARAGPDFSAQPDAAAVAATRRNLLGPQVLDAQRWPEIRVLARVDDLAPGDTQADLHLSVRGIGRRYRVPVLIEAAGDALAVSGSLVVRQSDLGIVPFSVLGGALQVRDGIEVDFRVVGRNSGGAMW